MPASAATDETADKTAESIEQNKDDAGEDQRRQPRDYTLAHVANGLPETVEGHALPLTIAKCTRHRCPLGSLGLSEWEIGAAALILGHSSFASGNVFQTNFCAILFAKDASNNLFAEDASKNITLCGRRRGCSAPGPSRTQITTDRLGEEQ
jgi:hypothetical protein